jgi:hypothetical protein
LKLPRVISELSRERTSERQVIRDCYRKWPESHLIVTTKTSAAGQNTQGDSVHKSGGVWHGFIEEYASHSHAVVNSGANGFVPGR